MNTQSVNAFNGTYEIDSWPDGKPFYYIIDDLSDPAVRLLPPYFPTQEQAQAWADSFNRSGLRVSMGKCLL